MKKIITLLFFVTTIAQAQYTINGVMTPPEETDWIILYKIEGTKQKFIKHSTIKKEDVAVEGAKQKIGRFSFVLPADAKPGSYRATYRDKGAGFIDFLFNKENIELVFNPEFPDQSVVFTKSLENKVYREYTEATSLVQKDIDTYQEKFISGHSKSDKKAYKKAYKKLEELQDLYEGKSKGMLANTFIKASKAVNPSSIQDTPKEHLDAIVKNFFNNIDFTNKNLYNSSFLIDKITDYVFYLRMASDQPTQQKMYKESIANVMNKISEDPLKKEVLEFLISTFTGKRNSEIVDQLFANYYNKLPANLQDTKFKNDKINLLTATVGRIAPDFSWVEGGKNYKLSTINDADEYLLIFWSTQCSHCVKEIPDLYNFMQAQQPKTSVIAFAVEMNDIDYNSWAKNKLYKWHNVMGTHPVNKWDNETVLKYNLVGTPTYFILNKDKRIIAMPDNLEQVQQYYKAKK